jgi:heterotetrameric sarcosine oxidase gamma subunit
VVREACRKRDDLMAAGHLDFLSPDLAAPEAVWRSPLERALAHAPEALDDVSRTALFEVLGDVAGLDAPGGEVVRLTPERALVLCAFEEAARVRTALTGAGRTVVDVSAGWAGLRIRGETVLRRLTDLDLDALPAAGSLAHVRALVLRDDEETFRVFVGQEYGHYVAEVAADAARGVGQ